MRKLLTAILIITTITSCLEIEPEPQTTFRKVVGGLGQSLGRKLVKMDDGSIIMLGSESIVAKREIQNPEGTAETVEISIVAPSLVKLDPTGNMIDGSRRVYPMYDHKAKAGEEVGLYDRVNIDITNAGELIDIKKIAGGYFVVGKWTKVFLDINLPELDNTVYQDFINDWHYFLILDEDFNIKSMRSMNAESLAENSVNGVFVNHRFRNLLQMEDGSIRMLTMTYSFNEFELPASFTIWSISNTGNVESQSYYTPDTGIEDNRAYRMSKGKNGNLLLLTRMTESVYTIDRTATKLGLLEFDPETLTLIPNGPQEVNLTKTDQFFGESVMSRKINSNTMQFLTPGFTFWNEIAGEYAIFYFHRFEHYITRVDESKVEIDYFIANRGRVLSLEDAIMTSDGGYIVLSEPDNQATGISDTEIIKLDQNGKVVWEKRFPGYPRSVIETEGGDILFISNPFFNDIHKKTTITRLDKDGNL